MSDLLWAHPRPVVTCIPHLPVWAHPRCNQAYVLTPSPSPSPPLTSPHLSHTPSLPSPPLPSPPTHTLPSPPLPSHTHPPSPPLPHTPPLTSPHLSHTPSLPSHTHNQRLRKSSTLRRDVCCRTKREKFLTITKGRKSNSRFRGKCELL